MSRFLPVFAALLPVVLFNPTEILADVTSDTIVVHEYPDGAADNTLSWYGTDHIYYLDFPGNGVRILGPQSLSSSGTGVRHAVAQFVNPETPIRLGEGDSIILSARMTPDIATDTPAANALRFGLFYSKNNPENIFTYNSNRTVSHSGYMVLANTDDGVLSSFRRICHYMNGTFRPFQLIAGSQTGQAFQAGITLSTNPMTAGAFQQDQNYDLRLHITRSNATLVTLNASISGGHLASHGNIISTHTNNNYDKDLAYEFDTVAFATNPAAGLDTARFSDIKISIPPREGNLHIVREPAPVEQQVAIGSSITFSPVITGTPPQRSVLLRDGVEILSDENGSLSLTLSNLTTADTGNYVFRAINEFNEVSSAPAYIEVRTAETVRAPTFSAYFANNMILQRNKSNPIRGTASPNATISITLTNNSDNRIVSSAAGNADSEGNFLIPISIGNASTTPHTLTVNNTLESASVHDVLIGDLWLCCGQSNMDWTMNQVNKGEVTPDHILADIAEAVNYPYIRVYKSTNMFAPYPIETNPENTWYVNKDKPGNTTAVGYYFARTLARTVLPDVPIGLLDVNQGATRAQSWMERETLRRLGYPNYAVVPQKIATNSGSSTYNAMLHPIRETAIAGIIYYQGEDNAYNPTEYQDLFPKLVTHLRTDVFKCPDIPFYFVQLPNLNRTWAPLRVAQLKALALPNTAAAITIDVGIDDNLHPIDKTHVGFRLALHALRNLFGYTDLEPSGPVALSATTMGDGNVTLSFGHAPNAFMDASKYKDGMPAFQLSADGSNFYDAETSILSSKPSGIILRVSTPELSAPTHLRYAWHGTPSTPLYSQVTNPDPLLGNSTIYALPASPFEIVVTEGPSIASLTQDELLAYAFAANGTLDTQGDLSHLPQTNITGNNSLSISFTPKNPLLRYEVQESRDLQTWETIDTIETPSGEIVVRESTSDINTSPQLFLRIKVSPK